MTDQHTKLTVRNVMGAMGFFGDMVSRDTIKHSQAPHSLSLLPGFAASRDESVLVLRVFPVTSIHQ